MLPTKWTIYGCVFAFVWTAMFTFQIIRQRRRNKRHAARAVRADAENPREEGGNHFESVRVPNEESTGRDDVYLNDPSLAALQQRLKSRTGEDDPEMENLISEALCLSSAPVPTDFNEMVCSICLDDLAKDKLLFSSPNCHHTFHLKCIEQWIYKAASLRCPNCNQELDKITEQKYAPFASNLVEPVA